MPGYCDLRGTNETEWTSFDVDVMLMDYEETINVLDGEAAGRSKLRGRMIRDPIGAFLGHKVVFARSGMDSAAVAAFDNLWNWLKQHSVDDSVYIRAADGQDSIEYEAYYTNLNRKLEYVEDGVRFWNNITVNFIPIDPTVVPT